MKCIRCGNHNTECLDDILHVGYIVQIFKCLNCQGTITVVYNNAGSQDMFKSYNYRAPDVVINEDFNEVLNEVRSREAKHSNDILEDALRNNPAYKRFVEKLEGEKK